MDFNKLTLKSQEAVAAAQELARRAGNPELTPDHLTVALLDQELPRTLVDRAGYGAGTLRAGLPNRAVRFGEQIWKAVPADYVIELAPRDLVELLYPIPFRESLLKHACSRNVDPRFVLSIARQEAPNDDHHVDE